MKSKWFLVPVAILVLALVANIPMTVATAATPSIKLVLGGIGSVPWEIGPVAPGDNGIKPVTLSNTGFNGGFVSIWISDIINSEGENPQSETGNMTEPGELGDYLLLSISGIDLSTNVIMPATLSDFPHSDNDTRHIYVNPLKAFSSVNLQWDWRLPLETGNDIQGDTISFTINYMLEEVLPTPVPVPSPPPPPQDEGDPNTPSSTIEISIFGIPGAFKGDSTGTIRTTVTVTSADGKLTITLHEGTKAMDRNENPLTILTVNIDTSPPLPPAAAYTIGPVYDFGPDGTTFDPPITITLNYDSNTLPSDVNEQGLVIAYYDVAAGQWVEIPSIVNMADQTIAAQVSHFTTFAIIGNVKPEPSPMPTPAPSLPLSPIPTPEPSLPLSPMPVPPGAVTDPDNDSAPATLTAPVMPVLSEAQNNMNFWVILAILAVIEAIVLFYYILVVMMKRRLRWDWKLNVLTTSTVSSIVPTDEQKTLITARHQKRVAELARAITGEMNLSKKLAGNDILLTARILAVAGVVEAMANTVKKIPSPKPHPPAMILEKIVEEIRRTGDSPYDSEVIRALTELIDHGKFRFQVNYD